MIGGFEMKVKAVRIAVDILMFIVLILVVVTPYLLESRFGNLTRQQTFLFDSGNAGQWHQWLGWTLTVLMVLHLILNYKWILATTKNFGKVTKACKTHYIVMLLLIGFMTASIVSGAIWGSQGRLASDTVRMVHTLTSWAAIWVVGTHMGVHLIRFFSFFEKKKGKKK